MHIVSEISIDHLPKHINLSRQNVDHCIDIQRLNFYYGQERILKNINLPIKQRAVTAIIGASGSGKSTLLRTMNLIYKLYPEQRADGEVRFHGKNILTTKNDVNHLRSQIGMVFQKPTPFPMSISDNIAFAIKLHESINKPQLRDRVEHALRQAALWDEVKDKLNKNASCLSGGQQQRLCIARTIAIHPEVILLDEPTASLDPISTQKIEQLIQKLVNQYTVVMVTHNLMQAKRTADYMAFMSQGELIEYNDTLSFFNHPEDPRSREYIS